MSPQPARILVVEDEPHLAQGISDNLEAEGYEVRLAIDGERALQFFREEAFDLVLLDVMLPKHDGYTVCKAIREAGSDVPVLFLTARNTHAERICGLDVGGDDYLGKPFDLGELLARVRALLRRRSPALTDGMGRKERLLLQCLRDADGAAVGRDALLAAAWGDEVYPSSRELGQWIDKLRQHIEVDPDNPIYLTGTPSLGYCFRKK
jgi:DNA-binding response OmpR family regulator